ncbi:hypothetical protein L596_017948 [Steinernema carpocapsae]|nr:hypothetical protein L596_017948 [Steinernema carpocapsae]
MNRFAAPYSNPIMAKALLQVFPKMVYDQTKVTNAVKIAEEVLEEIGEEIDEISWLSPTTKANLKKMLSLDHITLGAPKSYLNASMLDKEIEFHRDFFQKINSSMPRILERFNLTEECGFYHMPWMFYVAGHSFQLQNEASHPDFHPSFASYFIPNAYNLRGDIMMTNAFMEPARDAENFTTLGFFGGILAHEIFHSFGVDLVDVEGVEELTSHSAYREGIRCLAEHYEGFGLETCGPEWDLGCLVHGMKPGGQQKVNEGFADVSAMRAIVRIVKKRHEWDVNRTRGRGLPTETLKSKLMDVFLGFGEFSCSSASSPWEEMASLDNDPHPRGSIRIKALLQQIPEFKQVYECTKEPVKQCDSFPREWLWKEASGMKTTTDKQADGIEPTTEADLASKSTGNNREEEADEATTPGRIRDNDLKVEKPPTEANVASEEEKDKNRTKNMTSESSSLVLLIFVMIYSVISFIL